MSKGKGVSGKTHTKAECNDYANKHNPNSKAYAAEKANHARNSSRAMKNARYDIGDVVGESFGWCDD